MDLVDYFYFVSINQSGDNTYSIVLRLNLHFPPTQYLWLYYYKDFSNVAPSHEFNL